MHSRVSKSDNMNDLNKGQDKIRKGERSCAEKSFAV